MGKETNETNYIPMKKKKIQNEVLKVILKHRLEIQKYTLRYVTSKSNIILNNIITSVYF